MTWVLDLALQNPWGICGDELLRPDGDRTIGALYLARASDARILDLVSAMEFIHITLI